MTNKPAKEIHIDNGKKILVNRVKYSDATIESLFHVMAHTAAIHDVLWELRGTEFFSASLIKELDKQSKKLSPIFAQNDPGYISDVAVKLTKLFSNFCKFSYELSLQPQPVIDRFEKEYTNLLISAGISVPLPELETV